jgi:hypothetical protein
VPCWDEPGPPGKRQNTDPWVFGPTFLYSNCRQLNPSGTPSALQRLSRGSLILFGSVLDGEFVLDTVFVVGESDAYRPVDGLTGVSDAFAVCTVESLAADPELSSEAIFTLMRGATPRQPVDGMFSFVPCRRWIGDESRFARPAVELADIIDARRRRGPSGAGHVRPRAEVAAAWASIVKQVTKADLELGVGLAEPPRCS